MKKKIITGFIVALTTVTSNAAVFEGSFAATVDVSRNLSMDAIESCHSYALTYARQAARFNCLQNSPNAKACDDGRHSSRLDYGQYGAFSNETAACQVTVVLRTR